MKLYNTLTKKIEDFSPINKEEVGYYTCGPTVYYNAHIGNLRTYIFEDYLKKILNFDGYKVKHVMNITDVGHLTSDGDEGSDKMELSAKKEGKSAEMIAKFYTEMFFKDFKELNCKMPDITCKATEHIKEMIELIKKLEKNGYTYKTSDGIYYDTSKFKNYDQLVGKEHLEGIKAGARIEYSNEKRNPTDFSLWKFSPKNEKRQMEWDSPWGIGFPGWHIECSSMSMKYLGETFDIHCGGVDHIPIHHTNEIAQSEGATGKKFVNYWVHGEFLVLGKDEKMSKSKDNFLTISLLKEKGFLPLSYRYFCSLTHYRKQLEFSFPALTSAQNALKSLKSLCLIIKNNAKGEKENKESSYYKQIKESFLNDLNIPKALGIFWQAIKDETLSYEEKLFYIKTFDKIFSFSLLEEENINIPEEILKLSQDRLEAKKNKDYKKADEIREIIKNKGWSIEDTKEGIKIIKG